MWLWDAVSVCKSVFSDQEAYSLVVCGDIGLEVNHTLPISQKRICRVPFCILFFYRLADVGQHFAISFKHEKTLLAFCACSFNLIVVFSNQARKAVFRTFITDI